LPPGLKRSVRAAIRAIAADPAIGDPLHGGLEERFKYRVRRFRIVYRVDRAQHVVHIVAVGHRRSVYDDLVRNGS
jgi:mRNA interferase RelE/StbE